LMRNKGLRFVCRPQKLRVVNTDTIFTTSYKNNPEITVPIAHFDGNYYADDATLKELKKSGRIVFKYIDNPNGSLNDIAGICNEAGNVLGMMPHPERAVAPLLGGSGHGSGNGTDGIALFKSVMEAIR